MRKVLIMKHISFFLVFLASVIFASAQDTCYVQLDNFTGFELSQSEFDELNQAACELVDSLPQEYQDSFKVFDFGFYLHNERMVGGKSEVFSKMLDSASLYSKYFISFAKYMIEDGQMKFIFELRLPNYIKSNCLPPNKLNGLIDRLDAILNKSNYTNEIDKEIAAINYLIETLSSSLECCYLGSERPIRVNVDPDSVKIDICINNSLEFEGEGCIALIDEKGKMPNIGIVIHYSDNDNSHQCTNLRAKLEVYYARGCDPKSACWNTYPSEREREDTVTTEIDFVEFGYYYSFSFDDFSYYGTTWPVVQGGRARVIIDDYINEIKSFDFTIKGSNPSIDLVLNYLDTSIFNNFWFYPKLLLHETNSNTSRRANEMKQFNPENNRLEDLENSWDDFSRCPNRGCPCGWGLGQIDIPKPHKQSLWDWKFNIYNVDNIIEAKSNEVENKITQFLNTKTEWEDENSPDTVEIHEGHECGGVTWVHGPSDLFCSNNQKIADYFSKEVDISDGERSFIDAMVLKRYNGVPGVDNDFYYLFLPEPTSNNPDPKPIWKIDETAHYGNNVNRYVEAVNETNIPNQ